MKKVITTLFLNLILVSASYAQQAMDVKDYVRQTFIRGIPYEQALQHYGVDDVPALKEMLKDPADINAWGNAIVLLEILGDESDLPAIVEFIERDPGGEYSVIHHRAKTGAIMGLGYLINHTKSTKALNYLSTSLQTSSWDQRKVSGLSRLHATYDERNVELSKYAILGLALSGTPEAASALKRLQAQKSTNSRFQAQVDSLVESAISENEKIAKQGLFEYYDKH